MNKRNVFASWLVTLLDNSEWSRCDWFHNGEEVVRISRHSEDNKIRQVQFIQDDNIHLNASLTGCDLRLNSVKTTDSGNWFCKLKSEAQKRFRVSHDVEVFWPTLLDIEAPKSVINGTKYEIRCLFQGGNPDPVISAVIANDEKVRPLRFISTEIQAGTSIMSLKLFLLNFCNLSCILGDVERKSLFEYVANVDDVNSFFQCVANQHTEEESNIFVVNSEIALENIFFKPVFISEHEEEVVSSKHEVILRFRVKK